MLSKDILRPGLFFLNFGTVFKTSPAIISKLLIEFF